jgi:hypothetical protein
LEAKCLGKEIFIGHRIKLLRLHFMAAQDNSPRRVWQTELCESFSGFLQEDVRKIRGRNIRRPAPLSLSEAGHFSFFCPHFSAYLFSFQNIGLNLSSESYFCTNPEQAHPRRNAFSSASILSAEMAFGLSRLLLNEKIGFPPTPVWPKLRRWVKM